jgi:hypothetical protein
MVHISVWFGAKTVGPAPDTCGSRMSLACSRHWHSGMPSIRRCEA